MFQAPGGRPGVCSDLAFVHTEGEEGRRDGWILRIGKGKGA